MVIIILSGLIWYPTCIAYKLCFCVPGCFRCLAIHSRQRKWGFSGFGIPLSPSKINYWLYHFLYFFIWIKIKIELIKNNHYYYTFNLTCLLTISHSDFSKCRMIRTIEVGVPTKYLYFSYSILSSEIFPTIWNYS